MCGIAGAKGFVDLGVLKRMKRLLAHRGPDQEGQFIDRDVMLGHRRLSILDLSERGRQPMSNPEGTIHVVFNGEIYNYPSLRTELEKEGFRFVSNSDTEVLVHGHAAWGDGLAARLDGDFAYAIWDARKKTLNLARDPMGVAPLYYAEFDGAFFFASEIKALFAYENVPRRLSLRGFSDYLSYRYPVGPGTLFDGIFKVQPGEQVTVGKKTTKKKYWIPDFSTDSSLSENQAVSTVRTLVQDAVKKRLQSDVPLGVYLSGGLDSSFITACAAAESENPVHTFSVVFGQEDASDEAAIDAVVSRFETKHEYLRVDSEPFDLLPRVCWHLDEPPADIAALPTYLMAQVTKKHATVVLTGDGGDEVFGGYPRYQTLLRIHQGRLPLKLASRLAGAFLKESLRDRLNDALSAQSDWDLMNAYAAAFSQKERKEVLSLALPIPAQMPNTFADLNLLQKLYAWDVRTLLPDDYLMKVNKMSLAHGVEARVPFLDKALVAYSSRLSPSFKTTLFSTRRIQRNAMRGLVPDVVLRKKKKGFNVPTARWMQQGLKDFAEPYFESLSRRRIFDSGYVSEFLNKWRTHQTYHARQFWTLLGFEIWHQTYLDPDGLPEKP